MFSGWQYRFGLTSVCVGWFALLSAAQADRFTYEQPKMGSPFRIIFYHHNPAMADKLAQECFSLVDSLNLIFSDYVENSEINRLRRNSWDTSAPPVMVSPPLFDILQRAAIAYQASGGVFDITVGALTQVWRRARKQGIFPDPDTLGLALQKTGFEKLRIDTIEHTVKMTVPGMQIDLGGIAQGYVAREVMALLKRNGVEQALVDASGDVVTLGSPPGKSGWTLGVNVPGQTAALLEARIVVSNLTVSTSGDAFQYMVHQGKRYAHMVDPRTGYGVTTQRNVTIIHPDAATADWLATACCILPKKQALKLVTSQGGEIWMGWVKNRRIRFRGTPGFDNYWLGQQAPPRKMKMDKENE